MSDYKVYVEKNVVLQKEYEYRVRSWLKEQGCDVYDTIPFFKDGVTCPKRYFDEKNKFRPLFVLKEVSLGFDEVNMLQTYNEEWGFVDKHNCDFAENKFDDIRVGSFIDWIRVAKLAKGLKEVYLGNEKPCYYGENMDMSFSEGGEEYTGPIEKYRKKDKKKNKYYYKNRTNNTNYIETMDRVAVIDIKKVGGGTWAGSPLSKATKHYLYHIEPFEDLLTRQIELINPTVIVCCGRDGGNIRKYLSNVEEKVSCKIWLEGYHPRMSSNKNFYDGPVSEYKKIVTDFDYSKE